MKKTILFLAALLAMATCWAQADTTEVIHGFIPPDYDHIKKVMNDKKSPQYYPRLEKMLSEADTNLEIQDLQVLYFGQTLMKGYFPYEDPKQVDEIRALLRQETISKKDAQEVISLANSMAKEDPSDPQSYWYKYIGQNILAKDYGGDTSVIEKTAMQCRMTMAAIQSTGDGSSPQTAFHVTKTAHEYFLINMFDFEFKSQELQFVDGHAYDKMNVAENPYGLEALWFNIDAIVASWDKIYNSTNKIINTTDFPTKPVTEITIGLDTRFELEIVKEGKKKSKFKIIAHGTPGYTLDLEADKLFPETIDENIIIGYFCMTKTGSGDPRPCLITKKGSEKSIYFMDTEIEENHNGKFIRTSNNGIFGTAMGVEIWNDPLTRIRIKNIRTKE